MTSAALSVSPLSSTPPDFLWLGIVSAFRETARNVGERSSSAKDCDCRRRPRANLYRFAGHPEALRRHQEGLSHEVLLHAAAQNRNVLLPHQGLAAHATRYDKLAQNFLSTTTLVAALCWIKL